MSFKKLVEMIAAAETVEDLNKCCGAVDRSYQSTETESKETLDDFINPKKYLSKITNCFTS